MSKVRYEIKAKTGTYKAKDGTDKTSYAKIGVVIQTDKGFMLKMDCIPVGWDGIAFLNEPQAQDKPKPAQSAAFAPVGDPGSPF